jgi:hypothetical protein
MKLRNYFAAVAGCALITMTGCRSYSPTATTWEVLLDSKHPERYAENFRGYKQPEFPAQGWTLDGDALKTVPGFGGADIMTRQMFANFEIEFEWRASSGGNGGVMYNVAETDGPPWSTGPEYQVLDDAGHSDGKEPKTSSGALYALIAPNDKMELRSLGDFNRSTIIVNRGQVEHWLNGWKVVEYRWDSPDLQEVIKRSKFAGLPGFMKQKHGYVVFQHHGEVVWYRNIRIRRL